MAKNVNAIAFYQEIHQALGEAGCPFCRLLNREANRKIEGVLREMVLDPDKWAEVNRSRGYCHQHTWMLARTGGALGTAIMMQGIAKTLLRILDAHEQAMAEKSGFKQLFSSLKMQRGTTARLAEELAPQIPCPICTSLQKTEKHLAGTFVDHVTGQHTLLPRYQASDGLCLPHFRLAITRASSRAKLKALIEGQRAIWERLHGELAEFIRKNDHRFKHEPFGQERDAWLRSLETMAGAAPPRIEDKYLVNRKDL